MRGRPICLIARMITDRSRRHKVLLPINQNHDNFQETVTKTNKTKQKQKQKTIRHHGRKNSSFLKKKSLWIIVAIETVIIIVISGFSVGFFNVIMWLQSITALQDN